MDYIDLCFSRFGYAIFLIQGIEKGVMNSLIASYADITKTRYDELLSEKVELTFGQLLRETKEKHIQNSQQ